ncbi:beta-galactosidase [Bacteroidia bacterium]|nr:beta-galactosidase [Bacteroidia bacterium]
MKKTILFLFTVVFSVGMNAQELPRIVENARGVKQLIVDGQPFIFLSGELHNSTASNLDYLNPRMKDLQERHLNSVIATVSWELFEPQEGQFDYSLVKGIIDRARQQNLKLILIWFGTWKNAGSTYVPEWVKQDIQRFPRLQIRNGKNTGTLSAFGENTVKADAKAFAKLMACIKEYDRKQQTVLMMQVENETGILGSSRDRNDKAEAAFKQAVPQELLSFLQLHETHLIPELQQMMKGRSLQEGADWQAVFGQGAEEVFSAWYVARFVNEVTQAGKNEYNIPMYANAWLDWSFGKDLIPDYPSGGPVSKMFDIWHAAAPAIDLIGADVYVDDFKKICQMYTQSGNPLFLPELAPSIRQAAYVFYAIGENAMCFAPFGIDGYHRERANIVAKSYQSLNGFLPFFSQYCGKENNKGLLYTNQKTEEIRLGDYRIRVEYTQERNEGENRPESGGLILQTGKDEFYVAGMGMNVFFYLQPNQAEDQVETVLHEEGEFTDGNWIPGRRMNGDELDIRIGSTPSMRKLRFHRFK